MFINSWKNKLNSIECFTYTTLHLSTELFVFTFSFYVNQLPKPTKCLVMTSRRVRIHSVISKLYYILGIKWFLHPWYKQSHTSLPHPPIIPFISPLIIPFIIPFRNTFAFFIRITSDVIFFSVHIWGRNYDMIWSCHYRWRLNTFERRKYAVWG